MKVKSYFALIANGLQSLARQVQELLLHVLLLIKVQLPVSLACMIIPKKSHIQIQLQFAPANSGRCLVTIKGEKNNELIGV